jgi:hypothetical protein
VWRRLIFRGSRNFDLAQRALTRSVPRCLGISGTRHPGACADEARLTDSLFLALRRLALFGSQVPQCDPFRSKAYHGGGKIEVLERWWCFGNVLQRAAGKGDGRKANIFFALVIRAVPNIGELRDKKGGYAGLSEGRPTCLPFEFTNRVQHYGRNMNGMPTVRSLSGQPSGSERRYFADGRTAPLLQFAR